MPTGAVRPAWPNRRRCPSWKAAPRPDGIGKGWTAQPCPVEIPVVIVRGEAPGPVLWLNGCVHGNEYCGTYIIHETLDRLDPAALSGVVVALPVVNLPPGSAPAPASCSGPIPSGSPTAPARP